VHLGQLLLTVVIFLGLAVPSALAQNAKTTCGPDHAILYHRAVSLVNQAEKKLRGRYTAEAKALLKEANSLFSILVKECGPVQRERLLTDQEAQQEAVNQKLAADSLSQAERLMASATQKEAKSAELERQGHKDLSISYQRQAKGEYELAHIRAIQSQIYALRNQQLIFRYLSR